MGFKMNDEIYLQIITELARWNYLKGIAFDNDIRYGGLPLETQITPSRKYNLLEIMNSPEIGSIMKTLRSVAVDYTIDKRKYKLKNMFAAFEVRKLKKENDIIYDLILGVYNEIQSKLIIPIGQRVYPDDFDRIKDAAKDLYMNNERTYIQAEISHKNSHG